MKNRSTGCWMKGVTTVVVLCLVSLVAACDDGGGFLSAPVGGTFPVDTNQPDPADAALPGSVGETPPVESPAVMSGEGDVGKPADTASSGVYIIWSTDDFINPVLKKKPIPGGININPLPYEQFPKPSSQNNDDVEYAWDNIRLQTSFSTIVASPYYKNPSILLTLYADKLLVGHVEYDLSSCAANTDKCASHKEITVVDDKQKVTDINVVKIELKEFYPSNLVAAIKVKIDNIKIEKMYGNVPAVLAQTCELHSFDAVFPSGVSFPIIEDTLLWNGPNGFYHCPQNAAEPDPAQLDFQPDWAK